METLKFENYLEEQGLAKSSIRTNMMNIAKFFIFCKDNSISQDDICENVIKSYIDFIKKNYSNNTQLSNIQALRKFLSFIGRDDLQKYVFIGRNYSISDTATVGLTNDKLQRLLNFLPSLLKTNTFIRENARNALAVKLLLACKNIKTGELLELKFGDFILEQDIFVIKIKNKRAKVKSYFIEKEFEMLLPYRDLLDDYIFISKEKKLMGTIILRYNTLEIGKAVQIEGLIPSVLKKTYFII